VITNKWPEGNTLKKAISATSLDVKEPKASSVWASLPLTRSSAGDSRQPLYALALHRSTLVISLQYLAKILAGMNVSEVTYSVLSGTRNLNSINYKVGA